MTEATIAKTNQSKVTVLDPIPGLKGWSTYRRLWSYFFAFSVSSLFCWTVYLINTVPKATQINELQALPARIFLGIFVLQLIVGLVLSPFRKNMASQIHNGLEGKMESLLRGSEIAKVPSLNEVTNVILPDIAKGRERLVIVENASPKQPFVEIGLNRQGQVTLKRSNGLPE